MEEGWYWSANNRRLHADNTFSHQNNILICGLVITFLTAVGFFALLLYVKRVQRRAIEGDDSASRRMLLPCYKPFLSFLGLYYMVLAFIYVFFIAAKIRAQRLFALVQFSFFCSVAVNTIVPYILVIRFITYSNFVKMFCMFMPWFVICCVVLLIPRITDNLDFDLEEWCNIAFLFIGAIPPFVFGIALYFGFIRSRINRVSKSSTNCTILLILSSFALIVSSVLFLLYHRTLDPSTTAYEVIDDISVFLTIAEAIGNLLLPLAAYRTLNADTKYWRGVGKYHQGGISGGCTKPSIREGSFYFRKSQMAALGNLRDSSARSTITTIDISMATDFQRVLNTLKNLLIDFVMVEIQDKIGKGATATVFRGEFKRNLVAIKVTSPPEITTESLASFKHEADIMRLMANENVVKFYGIIIRPPQVGMIFELCAGGSLKEQLEKYGNDWTYIDRLRACKQAASAVAYVHSKQIMHRDIKPDNFFVGRNNTIKLGDFGEACPLLLEDELEEKMEICGTVAYMAPELVQGVRWYNEKVDIYALAVSFWEIVVNKEPYSELKTFAIYSTVLKGGRLSLDEYLVLKDRSGVPIPDGLKNILSEAWLQSPSERCDGKQLTALLQEYLSLEVLNARLSASNLDQDFVGFSKTKEIEYAGSTMFSKMFWLDHIEQLKEAAAQMFTETVASSSGGGDNFNEEQGGIVVDKGDVSAQGGRSRVVFPKRQSDRPNFEARIKAIDRASSRLHHHGDDNNNSSSYNSSNNSDSSSDVHGRHQSEMDRPTVLTNERSVDRIIRGSGDISMQDIIDSSFHLKMNTTANPTTSTVNPMFDNDGSGSCSSSRES